MANDQSCFITISCHDSYQYQPIFHHHSEDLSSTKPEKAPFQKLKKTLPYFFLKKVSFRITTKLKRAKAHVKSHMDGQGHRGLSLNMD